MKILYIVIDGNISGGNKVCTSILHGAKNAGHEVELLSPNAGPLTIALENKGIIVHKLSLARSFHLNKAIELAALLKREKIDLVHTHTSLNSEILARIACFIANVPIICHHHDPVDIFNKNSLISGYQHWLDRITSKCVHRFIAVSKSRYEAMVKYRGYAEDKISLIYNGINVEEFEYIDSEDMACKGLNLNKNDLAIGLIGRLEIAKGQDTLIKAGSSVIKQYPNAKFFIIGDDHIDGKPCLKRYQKMIKELKLEDRVFLLGLRPDIKQLIHSMDIIVLPSLWEAHSIAILEALAAKKPVIASEVGGTPEIIRNESEGILIPPKDPDALANAICRLIEDTGLVQKIKENGYKKVKENFSEERMIEMVFKVYEEVENR